MKQEYLFFDLGWTLEDETAAIMERARMTVSILLRYSITISTDQILHLHEEGAQQFTSEVYPYTLRKLGLDEETISSISIEASWNKNMLTLYPDAVETLEGLHEHHHLGIIANQSPGTVDRLKKYQIQDLFEYVFASAEAGLSKPDPRVFERAMKETGSIPSNSWMIGDRLDNDIAPAKMAG